MSAHTIYAALVNRDYSEPDALPERVAREVPRNGLKLVSAQTLQSSGDQTARASTVLPWLMHAVGAPTAMVGLLVPIRESGSMLPQVFLAPLVLRFAHRKWVFAGGALVQAGAVAAMALIAAFARGTAAGVGIIAALVVFSLGRCLCSIASKDVQGRTIPPGERGQITGLATSAAGIVAITLGVAIRLLGDGDPSAGALAVLLAVGSALWVLAALIYSRVVEPDGDVTARDNSSTNDEDEDSSGEDTESWFAMAARMLRDDATFRKFVITRGLVLVSSLSPPFFVTISVDAGTGILTGLGGFVLASGVASLVGGRIFGRLADRSSRLLMGWAAAAASAVVLSAVALVSLSSFDGQSLAGSAVLVGAYFLLTLLHSGVRVGRKTYIVDMADGDTRTTYVAISNSAMGLILLVVGGISSVLALWGEEWALVFLALLGVLGAASSMRLPEVSAGAL